MTRPDEHIFQHPRTDVFWFRRVIPPRLRPFMPDVPGLFPAKPARVQFIRTLGTKDRRRANTAALAIKQAVNHAFVEAERRRAAIGVLPAPPAGQDAPAALIVPIRREAALAAIERWRAQSLAEAELRQFNAPVLDDAAIYAAAEAEAPLLNALAAAAGQAATGVPWPEGGDIALAAALSGQGLPVDAAHPALPRLRRAFAAAWLSVLRAEADMRQGLWRTEAAADAPAPAPDPPAATPFLAHLDGWAAQLGMKSRQKGEYVAAVTAFAAHHPGLAPAGTAKRHGQGWMDALAEQGLTEGTITRKLSAVRNYWGWLQAQSQVGDEHRPFERLRLPGTVRKAPAPDAKPLPFTRAEVVRVWRAARDDGDAALADLIRLAAFTGARIESLCVLNRDLVRIDADSAIRYLQFADKTDAGVRAVPVHPAIAGMVDRLLRDSRDGYLIPEASKSKYGERSPLLSKRFTQLKRAEGFGAQHAFKSLRKTVSTLLQNSGCIEATAADIIGHEKPGLTYGLYSGGASLAEKLRWLKAALDYGDDGFMGSG